MLETSFIAPEIELPPTAAELPSEDNIPMETQRHKMQMDLLIDTTEIWLAPRSDGYTSGNMFVYFSLEQVRNRDFRGPDFFVVLGVPRRERLSWVVWEEGKAPDVVIELLSESTAPFDKDRKKLIYQNQLRVPEYYWFDPFNPDDWAGFHLQNGVYQPILPNERGQLISPTLGLALICWNGNYRGVETTWLRWANLAGELIPTLAEQERLRADRIQEQANNAEQRADRAESQLQQVARNLLQQGMSLNQVAQMTGLSESQIEQLNS
ncbi:Uma2 family endonuclease [Oscillatoria salina]|uniref:Uma2 family endonuclease n=1 Tax=Oscillatoria salina TaxID=331517 RepID=UPI0013BC4D70|nr:Uma2 family endonuclease [Oscillatoria salina]MBZ8179151.1 Uma2 family endonuclease [Oscillatoria salina IIICB1]NET88064.1 Uma2 family endonuclease [Kamptonema sp. SIO1D9]